MRIPVNIPTRVLCFILLALSLAAAASAGEVRIYLSNEDRVMGKELALDDQSLSVTTSHCGRVVVERWAVKGISRDTEHAEEILQSTGESDVVHNLNGDRLSGRVLGIKDEVISMQTFFAEGKTIEVKMEELGYLVFASQKKSEPSRNPEEVRVIFTNGDVLSGKIAGFELAPPGRGQFTLDPAHCDKVQFDASAFRSLHSADKSKEFFPGGMAEALMDVLEKSGEARGVYGQVYPSLIKSFLKEGDKEGAVHIFTRISLYLNDQYAFQRIGDEFLASNMLETAIQAYEKMMEKSPTYYYAYTKLFAVYVKMEKYAEAAETYERLLSNPAVNLSGHGIEADKIRTDLSDVYIKLKEFDKAAEQLHQVIVGPTENEDIRKTALSKLIGIFRDQGKIELLTGKYTAKLVEKNKILGDSYLELVKICLDEGKVMKAGTYVQRLENLGLTECAEKARELVKAYR